MNKLVLPQSFYEQADKPSPEFVAGLADIDPLLIVYWNRFRGRWVIDRYSCDNDGHKHQVSCPRQNVLIVQSPEGEFMPLNERVYERLREMDTWSQFKSGDEWNEATLAVRDAHKAAVDKSIRDDVRHLILDDKRQFQRIQTAIQMHDLRPNDVSRANCGSDEELRDAVIGQRSQGANK